MTLVPLFAFTRNAGRCEDKREEGGERSMYRAGSDPGHAQKGQYSTGARVMQVVFF